MAAHNNGNHKRGFLRPGGAGSRIPFFIIIGLAILCVIMLYNVYTGTARKNDLQEEIDVLRVKHHMCSKDKLDSEKKYEMITKSMKQKSESDSQKIKSLQSSNTDLTQQLKNVNEQLTELKDAKKSADEQLTQLVEAKQKIVDNLTETLQDVALLRAENEKLKVAAKSQPKTEFVDQNDKPAVKTETSFDYDKGKDTGSNAIRGQAVKDTREKDDQNVGKFEVKAITTESEKLSKKKILKPNSAVDDVRGGLEKDADVDTPKRRLNLNNVESNVAADSSNLTSDDDIISTKKPRRKGGRRTKNVTATTEISAIDKSPKLSVVGEPGPPSESTVVAENEKNVSLLDTSTDDVQTKTSLQNSSVDIVGKHGLLPPSGASSDFETSSSILHLGDKKQSDLQPSSDIKKQSDLQPSLDVKKQSELQSSAEKAASPRGLLAPLPTQLPSDSENIKPAEGVKNPFEPSKSTKNTKNAIADDLLKNADTKSGETKNDDDYSKDQNTDDVKEQNDKILKQKENLAEIFPTPKAPNISLKLKSNENKAKEDYQYRDNDEEAPSVVDSSKKRKQNVALADDKGKNAGY